MSAARIPLAIPNVGSGEARNLQKCVDDNWVSSVGPFVSEFEERVGDLSGTPRGVAMGAGTLALHMSLHCLGVGADDLVILPSFTFIASANSIAHAGARPWFIDIDPGSWSLDPAAVRAALEAHTQRRGEDLIHKPSGKRVAALMPVYTLGTPADMDAFGAIAKEYGLPIVADAAAAIGVDFRGRPIGEMADLTCYSFNGNKTITCGGGGMVVGRDPELLQKIKHISTTARVQPNYDHDAIGYNYRMTNLQAAVGCAQLDRLEDFIAVKRRIRTRYDEAITEIPGISAFPLPEDRGSTCWFSGFLVDDPALPRPPEICAELAKQNIEARIFWKPVHLQAPYMDCPCEDQSTAEALWDRIVTLPCSTMLTASDQDRVINAVRAIISGK